MIFLVPDLYANRIFYMNYIRSMPFTRWYDFKLGKLIRHIYLKFIGELIIKKTKLII
jgi:hypothetical protein